MPKWDMKVIEGTRKKYCELCGSPASGWPHHIKTRGAGGKDKSWNLIQLCGHCHELAQQYKIPPRKLINIVALREGMSVKEIYEKNEWIFEDLPSYEYRPELPPENPLAGKTYEEILELYFFCLDQGETSLWNQSAIITTMHDIMAMRPAEIASAVGCSASRVQKLTRTFNAFPDPEARSPLLSFRHHTIAAYTEHPHEWLAKAVDNQWSTRQLQEAVKGDISPEAAQEVLINKAKKIIKLIKEVLEVGGEPAEWLTHELQEILDKVEEAA